MDVQRFVYFFVGNGHLSCLTIINNAPMNASMTKSVVWTCVFISLVYMPRNEIYWIYGTFMFNF